MPACAGPPDVILSKEIFDGLDLCETLRRHLNAHRYATRQAGSRRLLRVRQFPLAGERANIRLGETSVYQWRHDATLHCRPQPRPVLAEIFDVRAHKNRLARISARCKKLNGVVKRALAVIAPIASVRPVAGERHLVRFYLLDGYADLRGNAVRVRALRRS